MTTYETMKFNLGRKAVTVVELDLDACGNDYGTSPCTAAIGVTGTQKCYKTFKTCQDAGHFNKQVKTYRLCKENAFLPIGENILPCITDFSIAPTKIEPESISLRASVSVTCKDFPYHDRGIDPYVGERSSPAKGTFFGRLKARNPYVVNRVMRIKTGYIDENRVIYSQTHTYLIDSIDGPDANGTVTIKAKDALKLADDDTAQCPVATKAKLPADITSTDARLGITPVGELDNFPDTGLVRVGDELIAYTSKSDNGLEGLTRAQRGTTADQHSAGDKVQLCKEYVGMTIPDIINDLLTNYASVPDGYIDLSAWEDENDRWLGLWKFGALITEPTGVSQLIGELLDSSYTMLWWDEVAAKIQFKVRQVPLPDALPPTLSDADNIISGSMKVQTKESDRVTRVSIYYGVQRAWDTIDKNNMKSLLVVVDSNAESENAHGEPKEKEIVSRWIQSDPVAKDLGAHVLARYRDAPTQLTFMLDAKDNGLLTGNLADIYSRLAQDTEGNDGGVRVLITERNEQQEGAQWQYTGEQSGKPGEVASLWAPDDCPAYDSASDEERGAYLFWSDDDGNLEGAPSDRLLF